MCLLGTKRALLLQTLYNDMGTSMGCKFAYFWLILLVAMLAYWWVAITQICRILVILVYCPTLAKRKQVTYHLNLSYWCFSILLSVLFFQATLYAYTTLILLRDMLCKTSWYSIDVSGNDRYILLFYKKFHFCHLLPFATVRQYTGRSQIHNFLLKNIIWSGMTQSWVLFENLQCTPSYQIIQGEYFFNSLKHLMMLLKCNFFFFRVSYITPYLGLCSGGTRI